MAHKTMLVKLAKSAGRREESKSKDLVKRAYLLAEKEFNPETPKGEIKLAHSVRVAKKLFDLGFDNATVAAGIVHELEFDGMVNSETIAEELGEEVASVITDYTKIRRIESRNLEKLSHGTFSTVILATAKDLRSIFIRLVSGLDALQNEANLSKKELETRAENTLNIYSPICQKLGLYEMQGMLEDSSLRILQPKVYDAVKKLLGKTRAERNQDVEGAIAEFSAVIGEEKKHVTLQGRAKSIFSIYKKMQKQNRKFEEIYDLIGIRMMCDSVRECYELLGIVHSEYKTVPRQFSDYIANPKKNGYRSIHTAVVWNQQPLEVQIRTWEMHYESETGLASHWQYKQYAKDRFFDKRLGWAKQVVEWHRNARDSADLMHSLKMGFGKNKIFVFTPKHDVIVLPEDSTPIDFAFAIHSDLGQRCLKAKVNGNIVHLSHELDNADIVDIVPSKQIMVKRQWLSFVKSHKALTKIKQKLGIKIPKKKLLPKKKAGTLTSDKNVKIAKCCNPMPGEEIVGVRTTKRKISVHRASCGNIDRMADDKRIRIKWDLAEKGYVAGIRVKARDSPGLLPAILKIISGNKAGITSTDTKTTKGNILQCNFNVKIRNIRQLENIIGKINSLPNVFRVERE